MSGNRRPVGIRVTAEGADQARAEVEKLGAIGDAAFGRIKAAAERAAPATSAAGDAAKQAARNMQGLAQQMPDVVQGILSGQSAFQLLVQQGGQVVSVTGGMGNALRTLVSFMGGPYVAAGLAAGAALAALAARSADLANEQRQLDVALRGVGRSAEIGAAGLASYTRALEKQGVAREEARKIAAELARTQGLSATNAGRVAGLSPDLAAALGVDAGAAAKQLTDAFAGGYDGIKRLDDALNVLTADQRAAIRVMLEHGDKAKAADLAFEALTTRLAGLNRDALSPMGQALRDLSAGWNGFVDSVANSSAMIALVKTLGLAVQGMAAVVGASASPASEIARLEGQLKGYQAGADLYGPESAPGQRAAELRQQIANLRAVQMMQGGAVTGGAAAAPPTPSPAPSVNEGDRQRKIVDEMTLSLAEEQRVMRAGLPDRARVRAEILAEKEARNQGLAADAAAELKKRRVAEVTLVAGDAAVQHAAAISREGQAALAMVAASDQGRAAMLQARAAAEAHEQAATQTGVAERALAQAILNRNAAQEAAKGADVVVGLREQVAATQALIAAEGQGSRAAYWAALDQRIKDATKELRAHRDAATDPAVRAALDKEIQQVAELTREQEAQNQALALKREMTQDREAIELLQRERDLVGETAATRERELATMRALQQLRRGGVDTDNLTPEQVAFVEGKRRLADVSSELKRQQDLYQELGGIGERAMDRIGDAAVQAAFSGQNAAINWGNVWRATAASVASDIAKLAFVNPVLNAVLGGDRKSLLSSTSLSGGGGGLGDLLGIGNLFGGGGIGNFLFGQSAVGALGPQIPTAGLLGSGGNLFGLEGLSLGGIGSGLGMIGAGIGVGNLLGGLVANSSAQRQNAMYGSLLGTLLGGPLGGAFGGLVGGLIGPKDSVEGWSYAIRGDGEGLGAGVGNQLKMTDVFYNESGKAQFDAANASIAQINEFLAANKLTVTGARAVGGNKNGPDDSWGGAASFGDALSALRFGARDNARLNTYLSGQSFDDPQKLAAAVQGFNAAAAAIDALGAEAVPAFTASLKAINDNFDAGVEQARKYGLAEAALTTARAKAIEALEAQRAETLRQTDVSLAIRRLAAGGDTMEAELARQAEAARQEIDTFGKSLDALAISAADKAARLVQLEEVQAAERAAIIERYGEQAAQALRQAGGTIRQYLDNLASGTAAGASPTDRLAAAQATFDRDRTLAMGGDRDALGRITQSADALLGAGRDVYASGSGFQDILTGVKTGLGGLPVVQSYDAMQAASLAAIQAALQSGTISTSTVILPAGNVVQIAGGLSLAGVTDGLAAVVANASQIAGVTNATLHSIDAGGVARHQTLVQSAVLLGNIVDSLFELRKVAVAAHETAVKQEAALYTLGTYGATANDNLRLGHRIATDASAAQIAALNLSNSIAADTRGDTLTAAGQLKVANNSLAALANYAIAGFQAQNAGNTIANDAAAAAAAGFAAVNTNLVNVGNAEVAALNAANTIAASNANAFVAALNAGNTIAASNATAFVAALNAGNTIAADGNRYGSFIDNTLKASANYQIAMIDELRGLRAENAAMRAEVAALKEALGVLNATVQQGATLNATETRAVRGAVIQVDDTLRRQVA